MFCCCGLKLLFFRMQHLQPGVLQGIELPVLGLVTSIVIGAADV